jgi:tRNA/rRNA methyltransferase
MIIILHHPQMAENVGFAARSMKNFGLTDLRLINPMKLEECEWEAKKHNDAIDIKEFMQKAEAVSKGGVEIVKNARIFNSIEEACFDVSKIYALSARRREIAKEVITPENAINEAMLSGEKCAFLFGRESSGLSNANLTSCYKMVEIEAEKSYPSINLGMSVGLIAYLFYKKQNGQKFLKTEREIKDLSTLQEKSKLLNFLEEKLEKADYFKVQEKKEGMMINIKNIFARTGLTSAEVRTLIGIFNLIKKI